MQTGGIRESQLPKVDSRLSFQPVLNTWRNKIAEGGDGIAAFYGSLLASVEAVPALTMPIEDLSLLEEHKKLVDMIIASITPLTLSEEQDYYR